MKCYAPLHGWYSSTLTKYGKRRLVFSAREAFHDLHVSVPCGKCLACKLEKARHWAIRCQHESKMWKCNVFVTLTYRGKDLPLVDGVPTLRPRDFVLFMKRLRKSRDGVRFFHAGEYGSLGRPHHHAILFNCDFPDKVFFKMAKGIPLYRSAELERLWPHGFSSVGSVTFESAGYVARYTVKKVDRKYVGCQVKEYCTMSRGGRGNGLGGIGLSWFRKYASDVYPTDKLVVRGGAISKPPRYYDDKRKESHPDEMRRVKLSRIAGSAGRPLEDDLVKKEIVERRVNDYLIRGDF